MVHVEVGQQATITELGKKRGDSYDPKACQKYFSRQSKKPTTPTPRTSTTSPTTT